MDQKSLTFPLSDETQIIEWLRSLGIVDVERALGNLQSIERSGLSSDLVPVICSQLADCLPKLSDPDMALNALDRYLHAVRSPLSFGSLCQHDPEALGTLMQLFACSRFLGDCLIADPESFELVRMTEGQPVSRHHLVEEIRDELRRLTDRRAAMAALRRHRRREILRIAYGDVVRQQRIHVVTEQISILAEALCEGALTFALQHAERTRGVPHGGLGQRSRFTIVALGKLGGTELNYSSDIDLLFLYEGEGFTVGEHRIANDEFYTRLAQDFVKLLTESTELGSVYRIDLRLRPHGQRGPLVARMESALQYYDTLGRTWERQAFVKARPIAGDLELGQEFLRSLEPWIYRRYLNRADITGIKALKRKIEQRAAWEGQDDRDVKSGRGGIRDTEFVIQFLQLLHGGDLPAVRTGNTLEAIDRLAEVGCLTLQERTFLADGYVFLRKIEHLLQMMLDLQTHTLPADDMQLSQLAMRLGFTGRSTAEVLQAFREAYRLHRDRNRRIFDHLLHDAFPDSPDPEPEVDLVLDPEPSPEFIRQTLAPYRFRDLPAAYEHLSSLALERIPFLSTRRCRHFLAAIAPMLLKAVSTTPDPDAALINLCHVSDSLGGKGVLWELFSVNAATLQLYVRLCASSPYLSGILTSNPGMLDELLDSLLLNKLPSRDGLATALLDRCKGAEDIEPILHSFKNVQHLNAGVRDILGKEDIRRTTEFLSDVAEVCLQQICDLLYPAMVARYGEPWHADQNRVCQMIVVALGKFGGREPNYHSDLDVLFLYETDGATRPALQGRGSVAITSNQHFVSELAQRIAKMVNQVGAYGRLYELDTRLRPTGASGALAMSFDAFQRYFVEGAAQLWERQSLCRARPIYGTAESRENVQRIVRSIVAMPVWIPAFTATIHANRLRLEEHATPRNLKRSPGGLMDIEFLVQMLQMRHAREFPAILQPGTFEALPALITAQLLQPEEGRELQVSYRFLRGLEARLRLMNTTARHDLPTDPRDLDKLAYLLGVDCGADLVEQAMQHLQRNREIYLRYMVEPEGPDG